MRFHPLAVSVVAGAFGSSSIANAFVLPKPASTSEPSRHFPMTRRVATAASVRMAANNEYTTLEENLFNGNKNDGSNIDGSVNTKNNAENPSTQPKKPRKPNNTRAEKIRAKLEADLAAAEESRERTAQQLANADTARLALEKEASKAAKEAEALGSKFNAFQAKEAARAAAGGGGLGAAGIAVEVAGPLLGGFAVFGGLAAARESLESRSAKAEEDRLQREQREEEERKTEEAAKRKATQQAQTKNLLPIVGAGVAGLGAFGAFFSSGGGSSDTVVDVMSKNALQNAGSEQQAMVGQQNNAGSATISALDSSATVDLPYLDKEIAKAETKQKQKKERPPKPKSQKELARIAMKDQRAMEARLEQKLADAPELARKAAEAEAKAKANEEARVEAEKKALLEKEAAELKATEEKKVLEAKQAAERKAAEEAAAAADKVAAEKKAAEELAITAEKLKAEKIAADRLAFEKMKAEETAKAEKISSQQKIAAEEKARAEKIAADKLAFEKMKAEEKAEAEKISSQQKIAAEEKARAEKIAADKLAFEKLKEEQKAKEEEAAAALQLLKQQGAQSQGFFPKVPAVSEMLFGNNRPSLITEKGLSNIFSPNKIVVGGVALAGVAVAAAVVAANESPSVSSTFKVSGKTPKEYLESEDEDTPKKTIRIPQTGNQDNQASADAPTTSPLFGSKEALREELAKQRDNLNRQAAMKASGGSTVEDTPTDDSLYSPPATSIDQPNPSFPNAAASEQNTNEGSSFAAMPKKSYSPFGVGKPRAAFSDSLYSPPTSQSATVDANTIEPLAQPVEPTPDQDTSGGSSSASLPKSSYSPFGAGKPKAVVNDSLYSPPASPSAMNDASTFEPSVQPIEPTPNQDATGGTLSNVLPKSSFSPFGRGKPKAVMNDSLYSPPSSYSIPESMPSMNDMGGEDPSASTTESNYSSFEESNPEAVASDSSDYASSPQYEPFTPNSSPPAPKNYSPFGGGKPFAATDDSLYRPPTSEDSSDGVGYNIPNAEPIIASTEAVIIDPEISALPPTQFSPFGGANPVASSNDSLYSPPSEETYDLTPNEEESLPFAASGLDDAAGPETTAFRPSSLKKSFSPFGSKPNAPTDTRGNGGGYLDGL